MQRPDTHVFDRPGAHVAEEIAQQVHYDRTAGEQEEHFRHREIRPEQLRIDVAQHLRGVDVREREPAETVEAESIERLVKPVKDLFGAIFFVSVGMMVDPAMIVEYAGPIVVITLAVILGQSLFGTL